MTIQSNSDACRALSRKNNVYSEICYSNLPAVIHQPLRIKRFRADWLPGQNHLKLETFQLPSTLFLGHSQHLIGAVPDLVSHLHCQVSTAELATPRIGAMSWGNLFKLTTSFHQRVQIQGSSFRRMHFLISF